MYCNFSRAHEGPQNMWPDPAVDLIAVDLISDSRSPYTSAVTCCEVFKRFLCGRREGTQSWAGVLLQTGVQKT